LEAVGFVARGHPCPERGKDGVWPLAAAWPPAMDRPRADGRLSNRLCLRDWQTTIATSPQAWRAAGVGVTLLRLLGGDQFASAAKTGL